MIKFEKLTIEGFGSIVTPTTFNLELEGLNVLRGRVGAGKTTIPSALCWALFGQSLKEKSQVRTWEEIRPKDFKGTKVDVQFVKGNHTYNVVRCETYKGKVVGKQKGGSKIFIIRDGVDTLEIDDPLFRDVKGKKEQQRLIEKIIGYSFELFKSSVIFGQKMKRIIEESGPQKKKIFEEAFEAGFIEDAKENEKKALQDFQNTLDDLVDREEDLKYKTEERKTLLEDALEDEANFEKDKKERIRELKKERKQYKKRIKELESTTYEGTTKKVDKEIEELEDKIATARDYNNKYNGYLRDKEHLEKEIKKKLREVEKPTPNCYACGRPLDKQKVEEYQKKIKREIEKLREDLKKATKKLKKSKQRDITQLQETLKQLRRDRDKIREKIIEQREREKQIPRLKEKTHQLRRDIKKLESKEIKIRSNIHKAKLEELENTLATVKEQIKGVKEEIEIKKWLIKDPLSNSGIKAYIFDSLLGKVNEKLEEYSNVLGFRVEFGIDLQAHNKDFYQAILKDDIVIPYQDLSGGQKQLVDTSIAFAIHDVISSIRPTNIMFMDEPFESLGDEEIELIEELIENKAKGKSLFLITHHKSFNPRNVNEIIFKISDKGHTKII